MSAGVLDLYCDQGETFSFEFQLLDDDNLPISMSGATITGKIREKHQDAAALASFVGTVTDGPNGTGTISLSAATTAALAVTNGAVAERNNRKYMYDVEVAFADGTIKRVLQGKFYLSPEVNK
jgi:hypothetical protein